LVKLTQGSRRTAQGRIDASLARICDPCYFNWSGTDCKSAPAEEEKRHNTQDSRFMD